MKELFCSLFLSFSVAQLFCSSVLVRSTSAINLPVLGRRQPLYLSFSLLQGPVFLLNSRLGYFTAATLSVGKAR